MKTLLLTGLTGANGGLVLAGLVAGAAVLVFGIAYAAERRSYRTFRQTAVEVVKTLVYAANKAVAAR